MTFAPFSSPALSPLCSLAPLCRVAPGWKAGSAGGSGVSGAPSASRPSLDPTYPAAGAAAEALEDARSTGMALPLALASMLVTVAVLVAPEQPSHQEAICQRHAGVEACRVW